MTEEPATLSEVLFHTARHNCPRKGRVKRHFIYDDNLFCEECNQGWSIKTLKRFSAQDLADRFFVRIPAPTNSSGTLVWVKDPVTKQHYASVVRNPSADAERVWPEEE